MATRILLVDDSATMRFTYEAILRKEGFEVETASDGAEALEKLVPNHGYDLVISDLIMPGLSGNELVATMRKTPRLQMLPVLMLTGSTDQQDLLDNLDAGVSDYVVKARKGKAEFLARVRNLVKFKMLQDELERASQTDALTGLFNRRYGVDRLEEEISRARRYDRELAVALIDLDHFKRINDTYGHHAGDEVLVTVSAGLGRVSRESDCVMRWGGEEFLFVFPETNLSEAAGIVERFRQHLVENPVHVSAEGGTLIPVTTSGGVSELEEGDSLESLVDRADAGLYRAKEQGRNQLVLSREGKFTGVSA